MNDHYVRDFFREEPEADRNLRAGEELAGEGVHLKRFTFSALSKVRIWVILSVSSMKKV